ILRLRRHDGRAARVFAGLEEIHLRPAHPFAFHRLDEGRHPQRERQPEDRHHPHDFDERKPGRRSGDASHHMRMLEVIENSADSTATRRKPTPSAMTQISTGSIMLIMTLSAMFNSPS